MAKGKVAIIGSGHIGAMWATLFASGGYTVCLYDVNEEAIEKARENVRKHLEKLEEQKLLRSQLSASEALKLVQATVDMNVALKDVIYAQESTCESPEFKRKIFAEMDGIAHENCILASSTSTIPASTFTETLKNRSRCVVAHPLNPPLYLRLVEVVPAPWTSPTVIQSTIDILKDIGQEPVRLQKEVLGFVINRLQYSLLAEAWRLVADDVVSVEDIDKVVSVGLGPRYAFHGPFETIHMNANGVQDYCNRYAAGMRRVMADVGKSPEFDEADVVEKLEKTLNVALPPEEMATHHKTRVDCLAKLEKLKHGL